MADKTLQSGSLREFLAREFSAAFERIGADPAFGAITISQRPELGQFQCNGAMPACKALKKPPREVAQAVLDALANKEIYADLSLAGPGFINISVTDEFLARFAQAIADDTRLGIPAASAPLHVVVDYGGPNVAKPMHVGHLRSSIIGDAIVRLMRFMGHDVKGDIHMGDWGTQMGMLIYELSQRQQDLLYFDKSFTGPYPTESPVTIEDLQEMYPKISGRCKEDEDVRRLCQLATVDLQQGRPGYRALWRHFVELSIKEMKDDFCQLGVDFDLWLGESDYHDRIPGMVTKLQADGHATEDQGAVVINVARETDNKPMPPVMLLKSDGGANYHTTDLATIQQRVTDFGAHLILYVVDKRQSLHFEQLFRAAEMTGIAGNTKMEHLGFGTMNGPDGRPFKTRAGGVMRLKDLIQMMTDEAHKRMIEANVATEYPAEEQDTIAKTVGMAALKYADLMNVRSSDYVFDIERFTRFEGRTGSYVLYAAVRIKSILRKAADAGFAAGKLLPPAVDSERALLLQIAQISDSVQKAVDERMPHHLCAYAFDLGQAFSRFYNDCHIMSEQDPARRASWLGVCELVLHQMETLLALLGISIPERM